MIASHTHKTSFNGALLGTNGGGTAFATGTGTAVNYGTTIAAAGGVETRPNNTAVAPVITI
jgi:hypothetical protein